MRDHARDGRHGSDRRCGGPAPVEQGEERPVLFDLDPSTRRLEDLASGVDLVRGDVGTFNHVLDVVKRVRPTRIYHLGAMLSVPCEADPPGAVRANALGTFHVLEAARLFDVPQVLFTSSIGTYGSGVGEGPLTNATLQRPHLPYGATKLFGEHLGLFYRRTRGLDFRGVRFPAIVVPGVTTPGVAQYIPWAIEASVKGPFTIPVAPETRVPILYLKDAARALVELAAAPEERIETAIYLLGGPTPVPNAGELAALIRTRGPGAQIEFRPDPALQRLVDPVVRPIVDDEARAEWGWQPRYDLEAMLDEFLMHRVFALDVLACRSVAAGCRSSPLCRTRRSCRPSLPTAGARAHRRHPVPPHPPTP